MSAEFRCTLACDNPLCTRTISDSDGLGIPVTAVEARVGAKLAGWQVGVTPQHPLREVRDYCPGHRLDKHRQVPDDWPL